MTAGEGFGEGVGVGGGAAGLRASPSPSHAQRLCSSHLPDPFDYPADPAEAEGGVPFGPEVSRSVDQ